MDQTSFVEAILLADLLREYYPNCLLYMGRDTDLDAMRARIRPPKTAKNQNGNASLYLTDEEHDTLNGLVTCTTLRSAMNAVFSRADSQKLKIQDPDNVQRLVRYSKLRYPNDLTTDLTRAYVNNPVTSQSYDAYTNAHKAADALRSARTALKKAQYVYDCEGTYKQADALEACRQAESAAHKAYNDAMKKLRDLPNYVPFDNTTFTCHAETVDGKAYDVYSATVDGYCYQYRVPADKDKSKGKPKKPHPEIRIQDALRPDRPPLVRAAGGQPGVDVRPVLDLMRSLPALQAWSDRLVKEKNEADREDFLEHEVTDDFGALTGFRLRAVDPTTVFASQVHSAQDAQRLKLLGEKDTPLDGATLLYRVEAADKRQNLSMVLTAYLPYLSTDLKLRMEEQMALTLKQREWYHDTLEVDDVRYRNGIPKAEHDPTAELNRAVEAVIAAKRHYEDEDDNEPDFWYEFNYMKWDWTRRDVTGRPKLVPITETVTDADGQTKRVPKVVQMLPIQLISSEGRIYLVGLRLEMDRSKNRRDGKWVLSNLRLDRIRGLHRVNADDPAAKLTNPQNRVRELPLYASEIFEDADRSRNMDYRNASPKMFSGTPEQLVLDCSPAIMNVLVDTFGADALAFQQMVDAPADLQSAPSAPWQRIAVTACWDGVQLFLLQNLQNVRLADLSGQKESKQAKRQTALRAQLAALLSNAGKAYGKK